MTEPFASYHRKLPDLAGQLASRGSLGVLVFDFSPLSVIEDQYGSRTYQEVRDQLFKLVAENQGKAFRSKDIPALDETRGLRLVLFADHRRDALPMLQSDVRVLRRRLTSDLVPRLAKIALPYLKSLPRIDVGQGLAVYNPIMHPARQIARAVQEAIRYGAVRRQVEEFETLEKLQEVILTERIMTAFQPIVGIEDRKILGYEALTRGGDVANPQMADALFSIAQEHRLLVELDRLCRRKALLSSKRLPPDAKIFINTLPVTIRDPEFQGKHLIKFLEQARVSPHRIVIEITEKLVIENYSLFQDAMSYFTELGMSLAVDDVCAGYSGLETIARLTPAYLKIDMALVRDVHASTVNQQMVGAIIALGHGIGAKVIAEGIQTEDELRTLVSLGVDYGQGYLIGRPGLTP
jgi:EAL domain-containing protein (putative c-di-GMP-specific phosphodiesterase class I)